MRRVQRAVVAYAAWLDLLVVEVACLLFYNTLITLIEQRVEVLLAAHRVRRVTVKLANVLIP